MSERATHYDAVIVQIARLGDLAQAWFLAHVLHQRHGWGNTALVVDESLETLAAAMVGSENVIPVSVKRALCSFSINENGRDALRSLSRRLNAIRAVHAINLNFNPAAAAIAEAIPAFNRLGARWRDVVSGVPSDAYMMELWRANRGERTGRLHICDIWKMYAGGAGDYYINRNVSPANTVASVAAPSNPAVAIVPGSGLRARNWGADNFRRLTEAVSEMAPVILIGSAAEAALAEEIIAGLPERAKRRCRSLCGMTDLSGLMRGLAGSRLVIGVDTGPLHLAAALGAPTLGIYFGSMHHRETAPYSDGGVVIIPDDPDYPCHEREIEMRPAGYQNAIPAEPVIDAAVSLLTGRTPTRHHGVSIMKSTIGERGLAWNAFPHCKAEDVAAEECKVLQY